MAKILLVEDDTNLSEIYQARMEAEGYTVVSASDGEAALAVAAKEKPDLIISDVMMPKISGFEMLDILRNTAGLKNTPVIMLTALGQADDKTRADQLGADRYLVKSQVTLEDIVNAAHALLSDDGSQHGETASSDAATPAASAETTSSTPAEPAAEASPTATPAASTPVETTETVVPVSVEPAVAPAPEPTPAATPSIQPIAVATPPAEPAAGPAPTVTPEPTPSPVPAPTADTPAELDHSDVVNLQAPTVSGPAPGGPGATITPSAASTPATPAPHVTAAPLDGAVIDDHAVDNAVGSLLGQQNDATTVAGQRVILPPAQTPTPSLDELLAKEEQRENGGQPGGTVAPQSGNGVDPNSIAL